MIIHLNKYWLDHFASGLSYVGRNEGEDEWIGTDEQWELLTKLESNESNNN